MIDYRTTEFKKTLDLVALIDNEVNNAILAYDIPTVVINMMLAVVFLRRADRARYGNLFCDLRNFYARGWDEYPTTLYAAFQKMQSYVKSTVGFQQRSSSIITDCIMHSKNPPTFILMACAMFQNILVLLLKRMLRTKFTFISEMARSLLLENWKLVFFLWIRIALLSLVPKDSVTSYSFATLVTENKTFYTRRTDNAKSLFRSLGMPSYQALIDGIEINHIHDCPVSASDVKRCVYMNGPEIDILKDKTKRKQLPHVPHIDSIPLPKSISALNN